MAMTDDELLQLAAAAAREAPEQDWSQVRDRMLQVARSATRRTVPVEARWDADAALDGAPERAADRLLISDQVLLDALRRALTAVPGLRPERIRPVLSEGTLAAVRLDLAATFGTALPTAARGARRSVATVVADLLGDDPAGVPVEVRFTDVDAPVREPVRESADESVDAPGELAITQEERR